MLQPPQAVFPACICAAVLPIVHLMEDGEVREDGVAGRSLFTVSDSTQNTRLLKKLLYHLDLGPLVVGLFLWTLWATIHSVFARIHIAFNVSSVSAVAQQILWNCLIEDPALVLRHFLEKLTVSNRQVSEHMKT